METEEIRAEILLLFVDVLIRFDSISRNLVRVLRRHALTRVEVVPIKVVIPKSRVKSLQESKGRNFESNESYNGSKSIRSPVLRVEGHTVRFESRWLASLCRIQKQNKMTAKRFFMYPAKQTNSNLTEYTHPLLYLLSNNWKRSREFVRRSCKEKANWVVTEKANDCFLLTPTYHGERSKRCRRR